MPPRKTNIGLRVWYGFSKLTKKVIQKRALAVIFENEWSLKNEDWVRQKYHVAYMRNQSPSEIKDASHKNRMFTTYYLFIDKKPFKGDIEKVLEENSLADRNHIPLIKRNEIKKALRRIYITAYPQLKGRETGSFSN